LSGQILVTGGTGLIGTVIVNRLLQAGHALTLLSRRPPQVSSERLRWLSADLAADPEAALGQVETVDAVVHAAAAMNDAGDARSLSLLQETNLRASDALFRWCGERAINRVVFVSSLSVLRRPLQVPIGEAHPVGPATPYGMSKLWSEEQLRRGAREYGFTPVILRISSPIPPTFEALPRTVVKIWIEAALKNEPLKVFGSGSRSQDFVACTDVAEAVCQSLVAPAANDVYHIGSGIPLSMRELAQMIARFRNTPIVFEGVDPNESDRWQLSLEKARKDLNYVPQWSGPQAIESLLRTVL
jgi:UDP-glucose 4-epimerase